MIRAQDSYERITALPHVDEDRHRGTSPRETASLLGSAWAHRGVLTFLLLWLGAICYGFAALEKHEATPGAIGSPVPQEVKPNPHWSLAVYLHPQCPCSRATLKQLKAILDETSEPIDVTILFAWPAGAGEGWEDTPLRDLAREIPHAALVQDVNAARAHAVGAKASGHVELRNPAGDVVFRGGITVGRGRVADAAGRQAILAVLRGELAHREQPVFGCPLES